MGHENYHEQMRKPYHKESKFSPKLLGLIVLILVIAIAAFISSSPTQQGKEPTGSDSGSGITGFLVDLSDKSLNLDSLFTSHGTLDFNTSRADSVVVKTSDPTNFKLNGEEIDVSDLSNAEISLTNFQGKIKVKDKKVSVEGFSDSLYLNTIGISKKKSAIEINSDFDSLHVSNIHLADQNFDELVGELTVSEKTKLELSYGKLSIKTFKGNVFVEENLTVSGLADKLSVKNENQNIDVSQ